MEHDTFKWKTFHLSFTHVQSIISNCVQLFILFLYLGAYLSHEEKNSFCCRNVAEFQPKHHNGLESDFDQGMDVGALRAGLSISETSRAPLRCGGIMLCDAMMSVWTKISSKMFPTLIKAVLKEKVGVLAGVPNKVAGESI